MEEPAVDLDTYRTLSDEASALDRERVEARRKIDHITALLGANTEAVSLYRDAYIAHVAARAFRAARQQIFSSRVDPLATEVRSEEHTSELQSLMRISYAVFCLKKKKNNAIPTQ